MVTVYTSSSRSEDSWIGLTRNHVNEWQWSDSSSYETFTNWATQVPQYWKHAFMYADNGTWYGIQPGAALGFVCEKQAQSAVQMTTGPVTLSSTGVMNTTDATPRAKMTTTVSFTTVDKTDSTQKAKITPSVSPTTIAKVSLSPTKPKTQDQKPVSSAHVSNQFTPSTIVPIHISVGKWSPTDNGMDKQTKAPVSGKSRNLSIVFCFCFRPT